MTAVALPTAVTHCQWETLGAREGLKEAERKPPHYLPLPPPLSYPSNQRGLASGAGQREAIRLAERETEAVGVLAVTRREAEGCC